MLYRVQGAQLEPSVFLVDPIYVILHNPYIFLATGEQHGHRTKEEKPGLHGKAAKMPNKKGGWGKNVKHF